MYNLYTCNSELILQELGSSIEAIDRKLRFDRDPELIGQREELYDLREWVESYMTPRKRESSSMIYYDARYHKTWRALNGRKSDENF